MKHLLLLFLALSLSAYADSTKTLEERLSKSPTNSRVRQLLGRAYFLQKNYPKVIEVLGPYSNEINGSSLNYLADAYEQTKDKLNRKRTLQLYAEREPNKYRPHFLLGEVYLEEKEYDKAAIEFRSSIQYASRHRSSYEGLLKVFLVNKQTYEARTLLNDMIKKFGPRGEFVTHQCSLHVDAGFLAEALVYCKEAIRRAPKSAENHIHLAQTYNLQKKSSAAEKVFINAAKQFPKDEYVQWAAGEHYYINKNFPIAVRYLEQAVKVDPKSGRAQLGLAESQFELGNHDKAVKHYFEACKIDKSNVAREAFRTAASKLRNKQNPASYEYDKMIQQCP
jgi:tetratricopeptide (TPR) repeat protein